jgi:hypothetical protein
MKDDDEYGGDPYPQEFIPGNALNVPEFLRGDGELPQTLAQMNDGCTAKSIKKHSFSEIADWIEANL